MGKGLSREEVLALLSNTSSIKANFWSIYSSSIVPPYTTPALINEGITATINISFT